MRRKEDTHRVPHYDKGHEEGNLEEKLDPLPTVDADEARHQYADDEHQ